MPEREDLSGLDIEEACDLADRWIVDPSVMHRLLLSALDFWQETRMPVWIISGHRTWAEQERLRMSGRPTASEETSTHRSCPATGVDISLGPAPTGPMIATWGRIVTMNGLRWGGGSRPDERGIPSDWGHSDLGPRQT